MGFIENLYYTMFAWLPSPIQIAFFIFIGLLVFWLILKLVAFIMDVLPFV